MFYQEKPAQADASVGQLPAGMTRAQLSYQLVRDRVIGPRCSECHINNPDNNVDLGSYSGVMNRLGDIKKDVFELKKMPKQRAPLTSDEAGILSTWIEMGAPEFASNGQPQNPDPSPSPSASPTPLTKLVPTYASITEHILRPRCFQCHSPGGEGAEHVILRTYDGILAKKEDFINTADQKAKIIQLLTTTNLDDRMPPPETGDGLTAEEIDVIKTWIDLGLPKGNIPDDPAKPLTPTYTDIQYRILSTSCTGCHNPKGKASDFPFQTYGDLLNPKSKVALITPGNPEKSVLLKMISGKKPKMPRKAAPLTPEEVGAIKTWIEQGAKND